MEMKSFPVTFTLLVGALLAHQIAAAPIQRGDVIFRPVVAEKGMVVGAEALAAEAALDVLQRGGNAVDAAVTMGFTIAVTLPRAGNIGGGGFMLVRMAGTGETVALDYRETAPAAAYRDMFLDEEGNPDPVLSRDSPLASGVPGTVAGLLAAHERFGSLPLEELMAPAIKLAREGFLVTPGMAESLEKAGADGRLKAEAKEVFFKEDNQPYQTGDRLLQPDLADSLERIATSGRAGFYTGPTAEAIVATLETRGGLITLQDLAEYEPVWREPVSGSYKEYTVHSMPPPSSGGVHLIQMLNLIKHFPLSTWGPNSSQGTHIMAEVMKRAYADRSEHLGDPDFESVPVAALISEEYELETLNRINSMTATASVDIKPGEPVLPESPETTHFSIVDAEGNAVSNTTTLNFSYGSGIMVDGAGFLLNNEMDDFSAKPGTPNAYGLIGGEKNAIEPRKRMLSSMTPTIVLQDDKVRIVTGSPGGSRIINTVLQVLLNVMEFDLNAAEANTAPRFHHQWLPDTLFVERGFPSDALRSLRLLGYQIETDGTIGCAQTIVVENGLLTGASDPRRDGGTALGY
jgi:gamma-glutamyltranspeptidase/glutathione hydrolase